MRSVALNILMSVAVACWPLVSAGQDFHFPAPESAADPDFPAVVRDLAGRVVPVYREDDSDLYLMNLAALQMAAGDPVAALETRRSLRERREREERMALAERAVVYDVYTEARAMEALDGVPFAEAYTRAFRETVGALDDLAAYEIERWFTAPIEPLEEAIRRALERQREKEAIALADALELVRAAVALDAYRSAAPFVPELLAEDTERRYVVEELAIAVAGDATVAATVVRPRAAAEAGPLPTLLEFALDRASRDAREAAARGYASVVVLARIAGEESARPRAPFETDGLDARAVIDWIATQTWSDGRVAMQGSGYGGFVAWAAAKTAPEALRAIATVDPMAPGIDVPMRGRIATSAAYRWVYELLATPAERIALGDAFWRGFVEDWYRSGRRYRDFPSLPGAGSSVFRSWLGHPSFDAFWQKWLPSPAELAALDVPVLTVTGYYSPGQAAALYYFTQHHRYKEAANHALLIGPYDAEALTQGVGASLRGLALDPAARVDLTDARYEWLAYALGRAERPALLAANVNYELAGANEWRHEAALPASPESRRFYFEARSGGAPHVLAHEMTPAPMMVIEESVDFTDRSDAEWRPSRGLLFSEFPEREGTLFLTAPFEQPVDLAGAVSGELDLTINKYDVDLVIALYELKADGEYVRLCGPDYEFRASYARDAVRRRLLVAGARQQVPFRMERFAGRRLEAGSRLGVALRINKRADQQINYGAADDVSEESIEDAGAPLRIRLHEGSFVDIPLR